MGQNRIAVIEDDDAIRAGVSAALRAAGYEPLEACDGERGLAVAQGIGIDLVLLDLMLPQRDGMDVLRALRTTHAALPVIILTARGAEDERIAGLKAGADDYVVKPFSARELIARVEAVLRRSPERPMQVRRLRAGNARVDLERREVRGPGESAGLSETECAILSHLASNSGRAISRDELLIRLWGLGGGIETRTVDMHVARLRAKLAAAAGDEGEYITTVRGKGYMLGSNVARDDASGGAPVESAQP